VGLAVAKGLALATGKPLLLVSSLRALAIDVARAATGAPFVIPCIDAGKGEVYACAVGAAAPTADDPWRLAPEALAERLAEYPGAILAGNGAERHAAAFDAALPSSVRRVTIEGPTALAIAELALARFARGEADDLDKAVPAYGRPPDITKKKPVVTG
jgi:tRNA threonylcarbamoyladenosine biosynthesis protein TsaB